jgi:hypothetical protein
MLNKIRFESQVIVHGSKESIKDFQESKKRFVCHFRFIFKFSVLLWALGIESLGDELTAPAAITYFVSSSGAVSQYAFAR